MRQCLQKTPLTEKKVLREQNHTGWLYSALFRKINALQKTGHIDHHDNRESLIFMTTYGARMIVSPVTR